MSWFRKAKKDKKIQPLPQATVDADAPKIPPTSDFPHPTAEETPAGSAAGVNDRSDPSRPGYLKRLKNRLFKTRQTFADGFDKILAGKKNIDQDVLEQLEELLVTADIGVQTAMDLVQRIAASKTASVDQMKTVLKEEILAILKTESAAPSPLSPPKPQVVMLVGVNGVGKTTTIGKLAAAAAQSGQKVLIAAADTFRAAAVEQLNIWAARAGAEIVTHRAGTDPAAVAFDSVAAAMARDVDVVLIDTAGRLHTKVNLMEELKKIKRSVAKKLPGAPHEILLILDATTGQNALSQAKLFDDALGLTGIVLAKLDGTAKGGIVVRICSTLKIPLKYIGIGEKIEDLQAFDAEHFVNALF
ncbi:MAG: signal recognition particle-docking protein FtsY [Desulfobacterales bacterium]|nr:MAG: signal recognition particle-docking protein FtsY [Desulfobacterales bacterium]